MVSELPIIDLELGAKILESDQQTAKKMIKELVASLPADLEQLQKAFMSDDPKKVADLAHYIHGGASFCGTPRLKKAAKELESQLKTSKNVSEANSFYLQLCKEINAVIKSAAELR